MKPYVILGDVIDGEENCTSSVVASSDSVRLWRDDGVGEGCVVGAIYCYDEGRLVVSEEVEDYVIGCSECVG